MRTPIDSANIDPKKPDAKKTGAKQADTKKAGNKKHGADKPAGNASDSSRRTERDALEQRARTDFDRGAVTADYEADRDEVLQMLDEALATELVCMLRYRRHYFAARGLRSKAAADEFLEHAQQELDHADRIAARITQLGGEPDLQPETLAARSHARYVECTTVEEMVTENLVAERIAIQTYRDAIRKIGDRDPTTRRLLEGILEVEEEHAEDLASLLPE